jgi:hypothetical protein
MNPKAPGGSRTHVAALRVRSPRRWTTSAKFRLGPEGLEPSPTRLRAGRSATRALVPTFATAGTNMSQSRPGRSRTFVFRLSAECSPLELRAEGYSTGAGGTRTPTSRLKRPICCLYTTTPRRNHHSGSCVSAETTYQLPRIRAAIAVFVATYGLFCAPQLCTLQRFSQQKKPGVLCRALSLREG